MKRKNSVTIFFILLNLVLFEIVGCSKGSDSSAPASADASAHAKAPVSKLKCIQEGIASWYGKHMKGRPTASGEKYDPKALTAASRKFPFGTELNVINLDNDRNVTVTVNDRGPYSGNRIIDMSVGAAQKLDMEKSGLAPVCVLNAERQVTQAEPEK
ncbi:MAG: septal ring lytic transglycosylase RlpA family protein [Candidatus Omnitrophota bacterium]|nr:septal ring lytic transglycosylase RlpA family protein [Candidatus Omnitrophota bacterium]